MNTIFSLESSRMVGLDPGYDIEDVALLGCSISPCILGRWNVVEYPALDGARMPGPVVAVHNSLPDAPSPTDSRWHLISEDISGDGGIQGIYDAECFGRVDLVPLDYRPSYDWSEFTEKIWYGYLCDVTLPQGIAVHPFGVSIIWDGGCTVSGIKDPYGNYHAIQLRPQ